MNVSVNPTDLPLVHKPFSAVEKAAPGMKRIISGMVLDALTLAKKTPQPRIVLVDDVDGALKLLETLIRMYFKDATVQSFCDGDQALQELLRADPDLLITDMNRGGLNGWKMLPLLAAKKVNFPILIVSGNATEEKIRQFAGSELNFSFLPKPFELAAFHREILTHLGGRLVKILTESHIEEATAQYNVACCYHQGYGVARDCVEAVKWYRKAAEQGDAEAQCWLGMSYATGDGVSQDAVEAYLWVKLAEDQGYERASKALDLVESLLSPEQLMEAKSRHHEFRLSKHLD
jgi:CheY-like chemotaxis protein